MPKKGHTEEQIVAVLRRVEAGARVGEVCRKAGISEATYYCGSFGADSQIPNLLRIEVGHVNPNRPGRSEKMRRAPRMQRPHAQKAEHGAEKSKAENVGHPPASLAILVQQTGNPKFP